MKFHNTVYNRLKVNQIKINFNLALNRNDFDTFAT